MATSKIPELQSQMDTALRSFDLALPELAKARADNNIAAIGLAAGRIRHLTGAIDQIATRLDAAVKWEAGGAE